MATRDGYNILVWLEERGWKCAPVDEDAYGDINVLHPDTNEEITVYQALKIHRDKTGEKFPMIMEEKSNINYEDKFYG